MVGEAGRFRAVVEYLIELQQLLGHNDVAFAAIIGWPRPTWSRVRRYQRQPTLALVATAMDRLPEHCEALRRLALPCPTDTADDAA